MPFNTGTSPQETFNLRVVRLRVLMANADAGHVAGEFVQLKRQVPPLLAGHLPVALNLRGEGGLRGHNHERPANERQANASRPRGSGTGQLALLAVFR